MIGGIIGDLAASTYIRDKELFYKQLIDEKSTLSEYGLTVFIANKILYDNDKAGQSISHLDAKAIFDNYFAKHSAYTGHTPHYHLNQEDGPNTVEQNALLLIRLLSAGWYDRDELVYCMMFNIFQEKEESYARLLTPDIIKSLRNGLSKDETYASQSPVFKGIRHNWQWKNGTSILCLLMRGWNCFYNSFDFGRAIHNAVRDMPENPRLMATIVGMMASAMYGNSIYYRKRKFDPDSFTPSTTLNIRTILPKEFYLEFDIIERQVNWQKAFFKKNDALTNVERHFYFHAQSKFEGMKITPETRRRILLSFPTSWENRFGFYLDNGWVYVYRSHYLFGRFKILKTNDGYVISHVQKADELPNGMLTIDKCIQSAMDAAIEFGSHIPYHYLYKVNCNENPYTRSDVTKSKFWECEKMFSNDIAESKWCEWIDNTRAAISSMESLDWISKYKSIGQDSAAILNYISNLYSKFCPFDNQDWQLNY